MLMADLRRDYVQTLFERLDDLAMSELEEQFKALEAEGRKALVDSGIALDRIVFERAADMRYVGQEHAVAVGMPGAVGDEGARAEDEAAVSTKPMSCATATARRKSPPISSACACRRSAG